MRQLFYIMIVSAILSSSILSAQDFNFSNYYATPLKVNPANTGSFDGTFRANSIYSSFQSSIAPRPYRSFALSVDARLKLGFRAQDRIGIGVLCNNFGSSGLVFASGGSQTNASSFNSWFIYRIGASYHFSIDVEQKQVISLGLVYSNGSRSYVKLSGSGGTVSPTWPNNIDSDIDLFNNNAQNGSLHTGNYISNMALGLLYTGKVNKSTWTIGTAYEGIFNPYVVEITDINTAEKTTVKLYGFNLHGAFDIHINNKWHVTPGFYYYSLGKANGFNINTQASYTIKPEKDFKILGGMGLRNQKYLMIFAGVTYKGFQWQLNRDFNMSSNIMRISGIEFSMRYTRKIKEK